MTLLLTAGGALAAVVIVTGLIGVLARRWRGGLAVALGAGYLVGHLVAATPAVPPIEVTDRIPWLALVAMLVGGAEAAWFSTSRWRLLDRAVLLAATCLAILGPIIGAEDAGEEGPGKTWMVAAAIVAIAAWANLEALASMPRSAGGSGGSAEPISEPDVGRQPAPASFPAEALAVLSGGAGAALILAHSLSLGLIAAGLAFALGVGALFLWRAPIAWRARSAGTVPAVVLTALLLDGYGYLQGALPTSAALLLAGAPASACVTRIGPLRRLRRWQSGLIELAITAIPVAIAVVLTYAAIPPEPEY
jgi:hypothetical protein